MSKNINTSLLKELFDLLQEGVQLFLNNRSPYERKLDQDGINFLHAVIVFLSARTAKQERDPIDACVDHILSHVHKEGLALSSATVQHILERHPLPVFVKAYLTVQEAMGAAEKAQVLKAQDKMVQRARAIDDYLSLKQEEGLKGRRTWPLESASTR